MTGLNRAASAKPAHGRPAGSDSPVQAEPLDGPNGRVMLVRLSRPRRLNAINTAMLDGLEQVIASVAGEPGIRGLVITGAGNRAFSAGAEVAELAGLDGQTAQARMEHGQRVFSALETLPVPVVAAVNGYALGGGLELAMACDLRVAARSAQFGQPEITLANIPGWGGTQRLPRLVGEGRAMELILTGRLIGAGEAAAIGLVHQVCADAAAASTALDLVNQVTARSPVAIAEAKQAIHAAREPGPAGYAVERHGVAACCGTAEQAAAVAAFLAGRGHEPPAIHQSAT